MLVKLIVSPEGSEELKPLSTNAGKGYCGYCGKELGGSHILDVASPDCCQEYKKHYERERLAREASRKICSWKRRGHYRIMEMLKVFEEMSALHLRLIAVRDNLMSVPNLREASRFNRFDMKLIAEFDRLNKGQMGFGGGSFNIMTGRQD